MKPMFRPLLFLLLLLFLKIGAEAQQHSEKPNVIMIFVDDMGYGDLGVYGHPSKKTPHLNKMAFEGQKWTNSIQQPMCAPHLGQRL